VLSLFGNGVAAAVIQPQRQSMYRKFAFATIETLKPPIRVAHTHEDARSGGVALTLCQYLCTVNEKDQS
jgi:hypothetical protein